MHSCPQDYSELLEVRECAEVQSTGEMKAEAKETHYQPIQNKMGYPLKKPPY
jgi:hypothetical protein